MISLLMVDVGFTNDADDDWNIRVVETEMSQSMNMSSIEGKGLELQLIVSCTTRKCSGESNGGVVLLLIWSLTILASLVHGVDTEPRNVFDFPSAIDLEPSNVGILQHDPLSNMRTLTLALQRAYMTRASAYRERCIESLHGRLPRRHTTSWYRKADPEPSVQISIESFSHLTGLEDQLKS
ncbi:hypothetical protein Tco_1289394, partial [Tanacetum coccineum]